MRLIEFQKPDASSGKYEKTSNLSGALRRRAFPPRARVVAERALADALRVGIKTARSLGKNGSGAARLRVLGVLFSVASCQPQTAAERRVVRAVAVEAAALIGEGATFFFRARTKRAHFFFLFF